MLDAAGVIAVLSDEGFPQPPIPAEEFSRAIGATVHRVARVEPWILTHREGGYDDLVSGIESEAATAAGDPNCVAYKSIVAYRTGLDVGDPPHRRPPRHWSAGAPMNGERAANTRNRCATS